MRFFVTACLLLGCAHKAAPVFEPPKVQRIDPVPAVKHEMPKVECLVDLECGPGMTCANNRCVVAIKPVASVACELTSIHFAYNSALISDGDRAVLAHDAECIKGRPLVTIEGNCDERGTEEYNMALGEMRAQAVKKQLVMRGIPSARLKAVSFGESRPLCNNHDEDCWQQNRRADLR